MALGNVSKLRPLKGLSRPVPCTLKVFALSESSHSKVLTADEKVRGPHLSLPELPQKHGMLTQDLSLPELPHLSLPDLKADNAIRDHNQSGNEKDGPLCTLVWRQRMGEAL